MPNPAKPTKLKLLEGTYRKDRANKNEAKLVAEIPACPDILQGVARAEWDRVSRELLASGLITRVDGAALMGYCLSYAAVVEAEEKITSKGLLVETQYGMAVNPAYGVKDKALRHMHRFLVEFGMTPASRTKAAAAPTGEQKAKKWG